MILINRDNDIVTNNNDLELLFTIKNFPVYYGCADDCFSPDNDIHCDLNFYISKSSGMVQINPLISLDILYGKNHSPGVVGKIWFDHHNQFCSFISRYNPKKVYEIGGGSGTLASTYVNTYNIDWTIIDPLSITNKKVKVINEFFTNKTELENDVDVFVNSHVLEHIYNPSEFFNHLSNIPMGKKLIFSVPNIQHGIEQKYTNAMGFEHTYFCTHEYITYWLNNNGFRLLETYDFLNHSRFYATEKTENLPAIECPNLYEKNKKLFMEFISFHRKNIQELNQKLESSVVPTFLFGGHIFSQFLVAMGLNTNRIDFVLDNNKDKNNHRLYGSNLIVKSPEILSSYVNPQIILQAGPYTDEIKDGLININATATFLL